MGGLNAVETQIAHGDSHTLYLASNGSVWAVGSNSYGQLGDGTEIARTVPVEVDISGISGHVVEIAAGGSHSVLRTTNGQVYAWGRNNYGQCGAPNSTPEYLIPRDVGVYPYARKISANYYQTLIARSDGNMSNFGYNANGQMGNDDVGVNSDTTIKALVTISGQEVIDVAAGKYHSLALCASGQVYSFGYNGYYELGNGVTTQSNLPVLATSLPYNIKKISAGDFHSLALNVNGNVYAWGRNSESQCHPTPSSSTSVPYIASTYSMDICAGAYSSYALKRGTVFAWGQNTYGNCGNGTDVTPVSGATQVGSLTSFYRALPNNTTQYCCSAIAADGKIKAWGYNNSQKLIVNDATLEILSPTSVVPTWPVEEIVDVEAGYFHVKSIRADGTVWSWGENASGQMGIGVANSTKYSTPTQSLLSENHMIASGTSTHSMTSRPYGRIDSWGKNGSGQLDTGVSSTNEPSVLYVGYHYPISLSTGSDHSVLVDDDGEIWATGSDGSGQLGDGTIGGTTHLFAKSPTAIDFKQVSAGTNHTVGLTATGLVYCWGEGSSYQLGNGSTTDYANPILVYKSSGLFDWLTNIIEVSAGNNYTLALDANGKIWSWGSN
ncbi:MAG: hypothetical protein HRU15_04935, partial [Planctomycetes bacterium]|nr:hypothetical protein [Planctomycetota bacterium]